MAVVWLPLLAFLLWPSKIGVNLAFYVPVTLTTEFNLWFAKHKNNTNKILWTKSFPLAASQQFYAMRCVCLTTRLFYLSGFSKDSWVSSVPWNRFYTRPVPAAAVLLCSCKHRWINRPPPPVLWVYSGPEDLLGTRVSKTVAVPQLNSSTRSIYQGERIFNINVEVCLNNIQLHVQTQMKYTPQHKWFTATRGLLEALVFLSVAACSFEDQTTWRMWRMSQKAKILSVLWIAFISFLWFHWIFFFFFKLVS